MPEDRISIIITRGLKAKIRELVSTIELRKNLLSAVSPELSRSFIIDEANNIGFRYEIDDILSMILISNYTQEQKVVLIESYFSGTLKISTDEDATEADLDLQARDENLSLSIEGLRNLFTDSTTIFSIANIGLLFYIQPDLARLKFAELLVNVTNRLPPDASKALKAILYPTLLYAAPETTADLACVHAIQAALKKINIEFGAEGLYFVLNGTNQILGDHAPSNLIESTYLTALEKMGPSTHVAIGAATLFTQYFDKFTESRFFKKFESFCDDMNGAPDGALASVSP